MPHFDAFFTHDILRIGLAAYGDLLAYYRPLWVIAVTMWIISIAFDLIQHDSLRGPLYKLIRGGFVLAYLADPAVIHTFAEILAIPDHSSGIILGRVLGGTTGPSSFSDTMGQLLLVVDGKTAAIMEADIFGINIMGYLIIVFIYGLLVCFLATVLYIKVLATFFQASLLFLLPLAVSLYPWPYTRPLFDGVIRQGISFSLVTPLLNVLIAMVTSPLIAALSDVNDNLFALVPFGCLAVAGSLLAWQIPSVASGVAGGIGLPILKPR